MRTLCFCMQNVMTSFSSCVVSRFFFFFGSLAQEQFPLRKAPSIIPYILYKLQKNLYMIVLAEWLLLYTYLFSHQSVLPFIPFFFSPKNKFHSEGKDYSFIHSFIHLRMNGELITEMSSSFS